MPPWWVGGRPGRQRQVIAGQLLVGCNVDLRSVLAVGGRAAREGLVFGGRCQILCVHFECARACVYDVCVLVHVYVCLCVCLKFAGAFCFNFCMLPCIVCPHIFSCHELHLVIGVVVAPCFTAMAW